VAGRREGGRGEGGRGPERGENLRFVSLGMFRVDSVTGNEGSAATKEPSGS